MPPLEETGPQKSWNLPDQENRLPPGRSPHTAPEMEDPQRLPRLAARTLPNQLVPSTTGPVKGAPRG